MYCIDSSSLITAWYENYPPDVLPPLWDRIDDLIASGSLISPSPVLDEIEKRSDELHKWLKSRDKMFVPLEENIQLKAKRILEQFPRLVMQKKSRFAADPFVIALAIETDCIIITEENPTGNENRPNIPDICNSEKFSKECDNLLGLIRQEKWVFN